MSQVFDARAYSWRGTHRPSLSSPEGPLAGSRLVVKDLFDIAGLPTGAGNPDWLATHPIPEHTAAAVETLLAAGATLVGKTQTDELAYSLNGLNAHYGAPLNPRAHDRLPGGSSTGSAVAVAAGEADIGLGSDTGGSIRVPASYNGLFGIRPTHGVVSAQGMVPLAPLFDTVGWMSRSAETLLAVGNVLLPGEAPSLNANGPLPVSVLEMVVDGARLWSAGHEAWLAEQSSLRVHRRIPVASDWLETASECFRILQGRAIWRIHGDWVRASKARFGRDIQARLDWCETLTASDEDRALADHARLKSDMEKWFAGVDALLLPTTPGPAPRLDADAQWLNDYRRQLMGLTAPAGLGGFPQIHMPGISLEGAPAGLSLMGRSGSDRLLLRAAIECSRAQSNKFLETDL